MLFLLIATLIILRPDIVRDRFYPPFSLHSVDEVVQLANTQPADKPLRLRIKTDKDGQSLERTFALKRPEGAKGDALTSVGLVVEKQSDRITIVDIAIDSAAEKARLDIAEKNQIIGIETRNEQPWKGWFAMPGLLLIAAVVVAQRRRLSAQKTS
jgi:hypothetical protein